jgi:hypothetical protein
MPPQIRVIWGLKSHMWRGSSNHIGDKQKNSTRREETARGN